MQQFHDCTFPLTTVFSTFVQVEDMLEYMFVMSSEAREWHGNSGVSLRFCISSWVFLIYFFFIVTTANLQSTPKGAITKWEGGYDGKEESSIDDTPKGPLGRGARVSRCTCSAGQTAIDASVSE